MISLRDYQQKIIDGVYDAWRDGHRNVLAVAPTGAGKTIIKSAIFQQCGVPGCAIAHRQELVGQISEALAACAVFHRIIAPKNVIRFIVAQHIKKFGRSFYHPQSPMAVAGIDTLLRRTDDLTQWINSVQIWDIDEAHHVLAENKWGKGVALFTRARGLGVTASPLRCDRKSLARSQKTGVFDKMVLGPSPRELIDRGFLAEYIVYGPPPSIDTSKIRVSDATGEFNQEELRKEAHKSQITGDIVEHYLKLTPGKLGITFCVDVEIAVETAKAYQQRGVSAEVVSAKTPDAVRTALIEKFRRGEIKQLVNVDLFGEGFDVPGVEVVSMGRPTQSFGLYLQQFGRCMRPAPDKSHGIVIDHVGNVKRHKLPDRPREWTLEIEQSERRKKSTDGEIPVTTCVACFRAYEAVTSRCPYCGHKPEPASRGAPEFVDGDLIEYGPELLQELGREIARVDGDPRIPTHLAGYAQEHIRWQWFVRQDAQRQLRETIQLWAGVQRDVYDRNDSEIYRRFYWTFGVDMMTAQTLNTDKALTLMEQIRGSFT